MKKEPGFGCKRSRKEKNSAVFETALFFCMKEKQALPKSRCVTAAVIKTVHNGKAGNPIKEYSAAFCTTYDRRLVVHAKMRYFGLVVVFQ